MYILLIHCPEGKIVQQQGKVEHPQKECFVIHTDDKGQRRRIPQKKRVCTHGEQHGTPLLHKAHLWGSSVKEMIYQHSFTKLLRLLYNWMIGYKQLTEKGKASSCSMISNSMEKCPLRYYIF